MRQREDDSKRARLLDVERTFAITGKEMEGLVRAFSLEMKRGLVGTKSSLKMIPAYIDRPTGKEKGRFIGLDVGGTNFRILELELRGSEKCRVLRERNFTLEAKCITGSGKDLFDFLADRVKDSIDTKRGIIDLGYTFSFPTDQSSLVSGRLLGWTKGFSARGVIGEDVVKLLSEAFTRKDIPNINIRALANDTVATLVAKSYEDARCDIAVILGTGTNASYVEDISKIGKWRGPKTPSGHMIINIEWGNFNKVKPTKYDRDLDKKSENPGEQILEKMVSGMYLGKLVSLILKTKIDNGLKTEQMSLIESDKSPDLLKTYRILKGLGMKKIIVEERRIVKKMCGIVSLRASRIIASCIVAVVKRMDPYLSREHVVAVDGSLYEKHPAFSKNIKAGIRELLGNKASKIKISMARGASGKGAAIMAAVAIES